jgi:hypothetical protein
MGRVTIAPLTDTQAESLINTLSKGTVVDPVTIIKEISVLSPPEIVYIEKPVEVIKEVTVIKEVPVEVIKEVQVEIIKEVPVLFEKIVEKPIIKYNNIVDIEGTLEQKRINQELKKQVKNYKVALGISALLILIAGVL